ncbi:anthranilate synthase component I family protein [Nitrososphaera sp.]|uniref:anthranilate synthase component I family protein n=1 Tax=Nitrososphaera sp. TaxID=1971748 RepID=UPI002ED9B698
MVAFGRPRLGKVKIRKLATADDQFSLFKKIYSLYDHAFILESLIGPKELAEMSVIGFDPEVTVTCDFRSLKVRNRRGRTKKYKVTEPLSQLRKLVPKVSDSSSRYIGGAVGYISYDAVRFWERLPIDKKKTKIGFPVMEFGIYHDGILYNHKENQAYYFCLGKSRLAEIERKIAKATAKPTHFSHTEPARNMTKEHFIDIVKKAKKYVYDGDVFQVVLAKNMRFEVEGDLLRFYEALREVNPSPYMYLLKSGRRCIIGSSPEMLLRVTKGHVETFPIAGTRPITDDEAKNEEMCRDLLKDEKELAEHTMLVDLARNDIGRVCEFGTVKVDELMTVKRFSHVQHIVSHVAGMLKKSFDSYDALKAVFPAGTVSGAPKVRAMEVIDELEPDLRGPYAGALGYFSFNGSCDFAITIRSLFVNGSKAYVQSGAGIVMDSDPAREWDETEHKAGAMLSALKKAAG